MKVAMTLVVRDEADIVDAQLAFHLSAGVDVVIATDHRSVDGTSEILDSYTQAGYVHVIREEGERVRQAEWTTRMARLAATEHGADWVLNADADEFWLPSGGSFADVLAAVPATHGAVRALVRPFVPRPDDGRGFSERMTTRLATPAPINDPATPYRPVHHVAHRAGAGVVVGQGSHVVHGLASGPLPGSFAVEVLHFPFRSAKQCAAKHAKTIAAWHGNLRADLARARRYAEAGNPGAFYEEVVVDDETMRRGLADGSLMEDVRVRDALRALSDGGGNFGPSAVRRGGLRLQRGAPGEEVAFAVDASCVAEAELVRVQRRLDELGSRLEGLTRRRGTRPRPFRGRSR